MNQYGSATRTYLASNVIEDIIAPPLPLVIAPTAPREQLLQAGGLWFTPPTPRGTDDWNLQANFIVRRIGVFSNFADGLVMLSPQIRPIVRMYAKSYLKINMPLPGTASLAAGTRNMIGAGTFWNTPGPSQLVPGDIVIVDGHPVIIETVTSDTTTTISQYAELVSNLPVAGASVYKTSVAPFTGAVQDVLPGIEAFNYMYECEYFMSAAILGGVNVTGFLIFCTIDLSGPLTLGTISIDPAWAGSPLFFDVQADVEITMR